MPVKRLIELRHLKEWTKVDTAKTLQIHLQRYNRIEKGISKPNKKDIQRMKTLLKKHESRRTPECRKLKSETIKTITGRMDRKVETWKDLDDDDKDLNLLREVLGIPRK